MFYLKWRTLQGHVMVVAYIYDGIGEQAGFTENGWKAHCIREGKKNGNTFIGMATEVDYRGDQQAVPCTWCGNPTRMLGTKHCDRCHELDIRIRTDRDIAAKILDHYEREDVPEVYTIYIQDENGRITEDVLCTHVVAEEIPASAVLEAEIGPDTRSEWKWFRLQNGELILGTFPRGGMYEELSEGLPI